jgi:S-adenosylmethionine:tRNA ribosyltransferase-isomerase
MVPEVGLEPTLVAQRDFESRASTSSATPARSRSIAVYNARAMQRSDFFYTLPSELIAQRAIEPRSAARMLCVNPDGPEDAGVADLPQRLQPGDLIVFNDTRVIPARLFATKASGGRVEIFIERLLEAHVALAQVRASKVLKPGGTLTVDDDGALITAEEREESFFRLRFAEPVLEVLERAGHVPLPPYISRADDAADRSRYQTLFAREPGAVAAPTASLHFDEPLIQRIRDRGVRVETLTLHVGAGTFQPVRVDDLQSHVMHPERYRVSEALADAVAQTRAAGGRVVAVGTTVVRALESAASSGALVAGSGETRLFITPGFEFRVVDAMLTNFHLPESTLLMLVSAFAGHQRIMAAYRHAVTQRYRFFSYGDAMWLPARM